MHWNKKQNIIKRHQRQLIEEEHVMNNLEMVIGIEVHAELLSEKKIYSPVEVTYKAEENTYTNIIDLGYPGVLPTVSKEVVELGLKAALALNCQINQKVVFDRKNYFYLDTPKGYQITQQRAPLGYNGYIDIEVAGKTKRIGITRLHLEEDAGKIFHEQDGAYVDFNRQGIPLIEIVTDASIRTEEEAGAYIEALRNVLVYLGVNDGKLEAGSLRCDANISLRPYGTDTYGTKTEIKNINSISNLKRALTLEKQRQMSELFHGRQVEQATMRYDDILKQNVVMRAKGGEADYRYFPEPDLSPMEIDDVWLETEKKNLPELPQARYQRMIEKYQLSAKDAQQIIDSKPQADFFDDAVQYDVAPQQVVNWLTGEIQQYLNKNKLELEETKLTGASLAEMIQMIENGDISSKIAKQVCEKLLQDGGNTQEVVEKMGVKQLSDPVAILTIVQEVLANHQQSIEDYKNGKDRAVGFLIGQIMKASGGQVNPMLTNKILLEELNKY